MNLYKNKKVLILGLGRYPQGSGISALKFLYRKGAMLVVSDTKSKKDMAKQLDRLKRYKGIRYILGPQENLPLKGLDLIVKNPGVRSDHPLLIKAKELGIPVESDITLFLKSVDNPIIGITGTRGKSTTSTLIHKLIQKKYPSAQLGGNIKISPLNFIGKLKKGVPVVLELSSWQLNSLAAVKISPQIAVMTNIMIDHLNMYPSFGAYVSDKKLIYKYQGKNDVLVLNKDDKLTYLMTKDAKSQIYLFSIKPLKISESGAFMNAKKDIYFQEGLIREKIINRSLIKLPGLHNVYNVMAAIIVAKRNGVPNPEIRRVLKNFAGIDSRLEMVKEYKGVRFYNDTTATTPDATIAAIRSFDRRPILICGGTDKELVFKDLANEINRKVRNLVLLPGTATERLKPMLKKERLSIIEAKSMAEAVKAAWEQSKAGDIILLSPGAASFGLFQNEFDRGDQFNGEIKKIR